LNGWSLRKSAKRWPGVNPRKPRISFTTPELSGPIPYVVQAFR
jgi:hypothetical protein